MVYPKKPTPTFSNMHEFQVLPKRNPIMKLHIFGNVPL